MLEKFWFGKETAETAVYMKEHFPKECAHVLEQAEKICRNTFVFREHWEMERTNEEVTFAGRVKWDFIPAGDPEWVFALNRHTCFLILGKAWRLTKDEKYVRKYAELLEDWLENEPLTEERRGGTWRSLEAGIRVENWLKSFLLFADSPLFAKELKERADECLIRHGEYLLEVNLPFHHLSNWGVLQNHGLALLGLYFGKEEWVHEAVRRLDEETYMQVFADGSQWEQSPMYHCEVLYGLFDSLLHLKRFGVPVPQRLTEAVRKMMYALAYWCKPDGHMPCQGDSDDIDARDMLANGALLFEDGTLKYMAGSLFFEDNLWSFGVSGVTRYQALAAEEPEETSKVLTDSGNYMLRSGWREDADYLRLHCGCMGSGHGHGDQLHVDYYSGGEDILIDPGRYTYVDGELRRELKMPSGHNTVCVDGEEFCSYIDSWGYGKIAYPVKGEHCFKGQVKLAMAGHLGYLEKGIFATRKAVTLEEGLVVITDVFYGSGSHTYDGSFYFSHKGGAELDKTQENIPAEITFRGEKVQAKVFAVKGKASLVKGHCSPEYNLLKECDCLKVHLEGEGQTSMYTVISAEGQKAVSGEAQRENSHRVSVELLPVSKVRSGEVLRPEQAEALRIVKNGKEHVVIFCHQELVSEVDYFTAGGYASYGKTIVFSEENPEGICVQY